MKTLFIHAKSNEAVLPAVEKAVKLLPKKIGIVTTIQHRHKLKEVKKLLEKKGKKVFTAGIVLGCDVSNAKKIEKKVDAFLYIGTGEFHPLGIALETKKPVFAANPSSKNVSKIKKSDIEKIKKKTKGTYLKFLTAKKIGILVSTKPGQNFSRSCSFPFPFHIRKEYRKIFHTQIIGFDIDIRSNLPESEL